MSVHFSEAKQSEDTQRVNRAARPNNNPAGRDNAVFCGKHVTLRQSYTTQHSCMCCRRRWAVVLFLSAGGEWKKKITTPRTPTILVSSFLLWGKDSKERYSSLTFCSCLSHTFSCGKWPVLFIYKSVKIAVRLSGGVQTWCIILCSFVFKSTTYWQQLWSQSDILNSFNQTK